MRFHYRRIQLSVKRALFISLSAWFVVFIKQLISCLKVSIIKAHTMKKLYPLLFFLLYSALQLSAQVADRSVTDCNNNSKSIYSVLASGKVLLVSSEGFDCSNCKNGAAALQSFAAQYSAQIEVWGAMTFTYSSATPDCNDVNDWINSYGWSNIFTFIDAGEFWFQSGTPRFTVYNPADTSIAYQGYNVTDARNIAQNLAATVHLKENFKKEFSLSYGDGIIRLINLPAGEVNVQLISITGKLLKTRQIISANKAENLSVKNLQPGIYLVNVQNNNGFQAVRKIYLR